MAATIARPPAPGFQALEIPPARVSKPWSFAARAAARLLIAALPACSGCGRRDGAGARAAATNEGIRVEVSLDRASIQVGMPVTANVRVEHPEDARISVDDPGRSNAVRVLDRRWAPPAPGRSEVAYDLTSFVVGDHTVFTGSVRVARAEEGTELAVPVPFVTLKVETSLGAADEELPPPAGLVDWPSAVPRWVWVLPLIAALAAAAGWVASRLVRRARRPGSAPPPPPAHETALAALRALEAKGWIEAGESEPFYVEVSRIVRVYLEGRFGLRAPERTTEEFIRDAAASGALSDAHRALTAEFLEYSDLVKFARARPGEAAMREAFRAAERLVRETTPAAPPAAGAAS